MSSGLWGGWGSWTSGVFFPGRVVLLPAKSPLPASLHALLQASRLEEWLSSVVRLAYVPKLNGKRSLKCLLGHGVSELRIAKSIASLHCSFVKKFKYS